MTGSRRHDVAIVGGGVAGATLAYVLARGGLDVVVLERQLQQRDRVMGEAMAPWGVAEAGAMDVFELMRPHGVVLDRVYSFESCGETPTATPPESLQERVAGVPGAFGVSNPGLAAVMTGYAQVAGAKVVYLAQVRSVDPPSLVVDVDGTTQTVEARMIVGADGKASGVRRALGIELHKVGPHAQCAGLLATGFGGGVPDDAVTTGLDEHSLRIVFPQGSGRARLYHMFRADRPNPYHGEQRATRFLQDFAGSLVPWGEGVAAAEAAGPCATFPIHDAWINVPHVPGAVLVGDAAGYSNPLCAQGLSVCMRDVRLVADALLGRDDWGPGVFDEYTSDRARRMEALRTFAQFFHLANIPGPDTVPFRRRIRAVVERDPRAGDALATIHTGPDRAPAHALDRGWLESTFGVRLGAEPAVIG